jgi:secreted PhoX family phosphatase
VDVLDSPDNLTVTPRGGLILCEDDAGSQDGDTLRSRPASRTSTA